jgi:hypothetical protein
MSLESVTAVAGFVTAFASIVLAYLTQVLARETERLRIDSSSAQIIASLQPSPWSMRHFDLVISNMGKATAFDIVINMTPDLVENESRQQGRNPLPKISVLMPNQFMKSSFSDFDHIKHTVFKLDISWATKPKSSFRDKLIYEINTEEFSAISRLGAESPLHSISDELTKIGKFIRKN